MENNEKKIEQLIHQDGVILYGAGRIGQQMYHTLKANGVYIKKIWDMYSKVKLEDGIYSEVPDFNTPNKKTVVIICINSNRIAEEVRNKLMEMGFCNIIKSEHLNINSFSDCGKKGIFNRRECNKCVVSGRGCSKYIEHIKNNHIQYVNIPLLALVPTYKCTLKCKDCVQFTGEFRKRKISWEYDMNSFIPAWNNFISAVGWVKVVTFTGGELFLYHDWKSLLEYCIKDERIGMINITTNGIHSLNDTDMKELKNDKIVITADYYESQLNEIQKNRFQDTINRFEQFGINYYILHNNPGTWSVHGNFENRDYSESELCEIYKNCPFSECYAIHTDLTFTICGRQNIAKKLGYIESCEIDCVDLKCDLAEEKIRMQIKDIVNRKYLDICKRCDANKNIVVAAIQE